MSHPADEVSHRRSGFRPNVVNPTRDLSIYRGDDVQYPKYFDVQENTCYKKANKADSGKLNLTRVFAVRTHKIDGTKRSRRSGPTGWLQCAFE